MVIPNPKVDYLRVTHPCATLLAPKGFRVRLACLWHAASVDSEPGSNSRYKFVLWNIIYYWSFCSVSIMTLASFERELYRSRFDSQRS